jgi:hypothetical protein
VEALGLNRRLSLERALRPDFPAKQRRKACLPCLGALDSVASQVPGKLAATIERKAYHRFGISVFPVKKYPSFLQSERFYHVKREQSAAT